METKNDLLVPPHDIEVEKAVLGSIFLSSEALNEIVDILYYDDFYLVTHQNLYKMIIEFSKVYNSVDIDYVSFKSFLEKNNSLASCGGEETLYSFSSGDFSCANISVYANIIIEKSTRRKLLVLSQDIKNGVFDLSKETISIVSDIEAAFTRISQRGLSNTQSYRTSSEVVEKVATDILEGKKTRSIKSGFSRLDAMTDGFRPHEMIIIGARPGIGKTAFALSMMLNMLRNNAKVGFFSLEMSGEEIVKRLFSNVSTIPYSRIRSNKLKRNINGEGQSSDQTKIFSAAEELSEKEFFIQDIPSMRLQDIRSQARKMKREHNVDIIIIDYIGLISVEASEKVPRHEQIAFVSRSIKQLARELEIPIVMLSQVTRDAENAEPNLSSLRESGAIEQDADAVMFLHRDRVKNQENVSPIQETKIILAKQRGGETGTIKIGFQGELVRFVDVENSY